MLKPYQRILRLPGAFAFSSTGWLARLPLSMVGLGLVLLVSQRTGSYGLAGTVSAAYVLAAALSAPVQGRLVDRVGQAPVLRIVGSMFAVGMTLTIVSIEADWPLPWPHICAALAGLTSTQVGSMVRARWSFIIKNRSQLTTAFALEAILDEMVFIVGPVLVTVLATTVSPVAGLAAAAMAAFAGTLMLASQKATQPPPSPHSAGDRLPMGWRLLGPVLVACVALGILFGSTEVIVVAFATELGQRAAAGPLLAIWAAGSLTGGLAAGAANLTMSPLQQLRFSILALTLLIAPLGFLDSVYLLGVGMFAAGFMIAPTMIAAMNLIHAHIPASRLTEGMTWTSMGLSVGVAPGAALAGWAVDHSGASSGFLVPLIAGAGATLVAWGFRPPPLPTGR